MKVEPIKTQPAFQPVEVKFVFESQAELDTLCALFNYAPVCSAVRKCLNESPSDPNEVSSVIRANLRKAGACDDKAHSEIVRFMDSYYGR